ncbi:MAG: DNA polymerase III subunit delta' [Nitrospirae bacterium]|nr:DNA polymerase III subunit delta' [Nitrospirota bacterium]
MSFKDVIGQDRAINILLGTLSRNRLPSAYLFVGESGIGKKFTAITLAKTLNCREIRDSLNVMRAEIDKNSLRITDYASRIDACDQCPSCKKIDSGTHPDFLTIIPEKGEIRVEDIRTVEESLSFTPYEGKRKVVIVDDAETMNSSAANAFLKTLEEPPPMSIIILISASPDRLPETIRSRCSRINFSPLSPERCKEVIKKESGRQATISSDKGNKKICDGPATDDYRLSTIARLSMGRPGLAITNDLFEDRDRFIKLFREMINRGNKEMWADKDEIEKWFNNAITVLRDTAVLKITGKEDMLINIDLKNNIAAMSKTTELKDIIDSYAKISFLKGYLGFNLNKSITWNYVSTIIQNLKVKI